MGVQQRITLAGCPVVEPNRQHPLSGHVLDTAMSTAGPQVLVQVANRFRQSRMMGGQYRPAGGRIPEAVEDRDALGRPQHHIKGGDGVAAMGPAQQLPGRRVAALEDPLEPRRRCFALQPQASSAGAVPPARGLAVAGQILFVVLGELAGVVGLPAHRQLGDVGHHPAAPLLALGGASERTRGALLSSDEFLVEGRANGEASSVMASLASKGSECWRLCEGTVDLG
jgi:hypothetical protein